jgi:integrase
MSELMLTTTGELLPADRNPCAVYLAGLGSDKSRRAMLGALKTVADQLGVADPLQVPWQEMRYQHVAAIRSRLMGSGLATATVNLALSAVRSVAREAYKLHLLSGEDYQRLLLVQGVKGERVPAGRCLPAGEIAALMAACANDHTAAGARDAAIIGTLYVGGLRRSEIPTLDVGDYTSPTGDMVVRGKGHKERVVYVNNGAGEALSDWLAVRGPEPGPLFLPVNKGGHLQRRRMSSQAVYGLLRKRAAEAGVRDFSPHDFRRTFVGDLLDAGADISTVQKLAGHASVTTTQRYDRRPEEAKRRAAGLLHLPYRSRRIVRTE